MNPHLNSILPRQSFFPFNAALSSAITMDGDPAVEPELDSFSLTLPLPYRVACVVVLGMPLSLCSDVSVALNFTDSI